MAKTPATVPEWRPGMPSVWVVVGRAGRRVVYNPVAIGAVARMMMIDRNEQEALVLAEECSAGSTDPRPCTCTPTKVVRS